MSNKRISSVTDGERPNRRNTRQRSIADIERGEDHNGVHCVRCPSEDDANLIGYDQQYAEMRPCKHAICLECPLFLFAAVDYPSQQEHQDENIRFLHSPYHSFVWKYNRDSSRYAVVLS
eukprot:scaffold23804_cov48-Cyclotella_meneghiniana.AAC.8